MSRYFGKAIWWHGEETLEYVRLNVYSGSTFLDRGWDTFDMYSPAHAHPQSPGAVTRRFRQAGFDDSNLRFGLNGVVGSGRRPAHT